MAKRNLKKVFIGLLFIFISIVLALVAFYQLEVKPELASRQATTGLSGDSLEDIAEEVQKEGLLEEEVPQQEKIVIDYDQGESTVREAVSEQEAEKVVETLKEKEVVSGHLWIDRKASKYVVTLGKKNGLVVGSRLIVFQDDQKIGKVEVDSVYETIAYVHPIDMSENLTDSDYYKVVLEN